MKNSDVRVEGVDSAQLEIQVQANSSLWILGDVNVSTITGGGSNYTSLRISFFQKVVIQSIDVDTLYLSGTEILIGNAQVNTLTLDKVENITLLAYANIGYTQTTTYNKQPQTIIYLGHGGPVGCDFHFQKTVNITGNIVSEDCMVHASDIIVEGGCVEGGAYMNVNNVVCPDAPYIMSGNYNPELVLNNK
jgi:hypothetical protein